MPGRSEVSNGLTPAAGGDMETVSALGEVASSVGPASLVMKGIHEFFGLLG